MEQIYYDIDKKVAYTSNSGPLSTEDDINKNKIDFSQFSGDAEFYIVHITGNGEQICKKRYEGGFENGEFDGEGKLFSKDGNVYEGEFKDGKMVDGEGIIVYKNGDEYKGDIKNKEPNGSGTFTYANGNIYKEYNGEFKDGEFNGQGTLIFANGDKYKGNFKDGEYDDEGTLYYNGKKKYKGKFENDKYNGKGLFYNNQLRFRGQFDNDVRMYGTSYLNKAHGNKKCYTLSRTDDGSKKLTYFLDGENVTLTIDKDGKLQWSGNITENTKEKAKTLFGSFSEEESEGYDLLLANLALINTNNNIVQYSNDVDFDPHQQEDFRNQFEKFANFAKKPENKGKVVTSELYPESHAVGIVYKDGKFVVIDTSGAIYLDKEAVKVLKEKNIDILEYYKGQTIGNCVWHQEWQLMNLPMIY